MIDETFDGGPFMKSIGGRLTELTGSKVVLEWSAGPAHHQPYGIVHGGVYTTIVETLGSVGSAMWFGDRGNVVGVNNNTDFFRAVSEGDLVSTATPLHQGRSQQVWIVETRDDQGRLIARGQLRVQNLEKRD